MFFPNVYRLFLVFINLGAKRFRDHEVVDQVEQNGNKCVGFDGIWLSLEYFGEVGDVEASLGAKRVHGREDVIKGHSSCPNLLDKFVELSALLAGTLILEHFDERKEKS